jgi:hypothetical protein
MDRSSTPQLKILSEVTITSPGPRRIRVRLARQTFPPGAVSRPVHLPAGRWIDHTADALAKGGGTIEAPALLERLPICVRAGAIVPAYPDDVTTLSDASHALAVAPGDWLDIRIWPRAPGSGYPAWRCSRTEDHTGMVSCRGCAAQEPAHPYATGRAARETLCW